MPNDPVEFFIDRAVTEGRKVKRHGRHWLVSCPGPNHAHGDRDPSLHVSYGRDGAAVLKCFAGCDARSIVERLGLKMSDLFPPSVDTRPPDKPLFWLSDEYPYVDGDGVVVASVLRYTGTAFDGKLEKTFRQRRPDGRGGWINNLEGVERPLYHLPQLRAGIATGAHVWIVEGEKDVHALELAGKVATTAGAAAAWRPELVEALTGAQSVTIVADRDTPGYDLAHRIEADVDAAGIPVRVLVSPFGKDASDHLAAGHALSELVPLETLPAPAADVEPAEGVDNSWEPVDLAAILAGAVTSNPPTILERSDGEHLIYPGRIHWVSGDPESGKSWFTYAAAVELIHLERPVAIIDFEDTAASAVERFRNLGLTDEQIAGHVRFIAPYQKLEPVAFAGLERSVHDTALVIVDACSEAMGLAGLDAYSNPDTVKWVDGFVKPIARAGPAVIVIDHMPKSRESGRRFMLGAGHKLAAVDGAAYTLDVIDPFARGVSGKVKVTIAKDRPGHIRSSSAGTRVAANMHLAADADGSVAITMHTADANAGTRPTGYMERISAWLTPMTEPVGTKELKSGVGGKSNHVSTALELLVAERFVERIYGANRSASYRSLKPYREIDERLEHAPVSDLAMSEADGLADDIFDGTPGS